MASVKSYNACDGYSSIAIYPFQDLFQRIPHFWFPSLWPSMSEKKMGINKNQKTGAL